MVRKLKMQINILKRFYKKLQLFYAKNGSKNQLLFKIWDHSENCQKWPSSKGYSLFKILTLSQKLKMQDNMLKTFFRHIAVSLYKKRLEKTANIQKMRPFWKLPNWPPSKGYSLCKILTLGQKLKIHKNMLETFLQRIVVALCQTRLQEN